MKLRGIKKKLIFGTSAFVIAMNMFNFCAASLQDKQNEYNSLDNQIKNNQNQKNAIDSDIASYINEIRDLDNSISTYNEKISNLQAEVNDVNSNIQECQNNLQNSAQLYNSAEDVYATRLRAIYENGVPSVFEILVSSDGIGDFFSRLNVYTSVLEYDRSLIGNMKSQKEYVDYLKTNIEENKITLEQLSYDLDKSLSELETVKASKETKVETLKSSKAYIDAATDALEAEKDKVEKEIQDELAKAQGNTGFFSGIFKWPANSSIITAGFGTYYPYGYAVNHTGVDIGVSIGNNVYSAASGKVVLAKTVTTDPNGAKYKGYGNYIIVDHGVGSDGRNIKTLYGHLSSVNVSVGQTVAQGQVIGYSGNTGNSTGPHLHFEVRINDRCVNPMQYFN